MADFDPTILPEAEAANEAATTQSLSWYQRNKERVCEKQRKEYAENKNGKKEKRAARGKAYYEKNKERLRPQTEEAIAKKKARQKRWYEANREKMMQRSKERYAAVKDINTSQRLERKFGITLEEYNAMFALQKGRCAVCGTKPRELDRFGNIRRLAVDHDHKTGRVRQLLCTPCNTSIGLVKENVKTLNKMIDYIKQHEDTNVKTVSITLTLDELQAVAGLIDAGVKAVGLTSVKSAAALLVKLEAAVAEANASDQKEPE